MNCNHVPRIQITQNGFVTALRCQCGRVTQSVSTTTFQAVNAPGKRTLSGVLLRGERK